MKILITGARSGIGFETAKYLESLGHYIYLGVHTDEEVLKVKESIDDSSKILPLKLDISDDKDLEKIDTLEYDIAFFNAAVGYGGTILEMDLDVVRENFEVNYFSTLKCIKKAYNNFLNHNKRGKIFVTSSLVGLMPLPYLSAYTSSKAALSSTIICMQQEIRKKTKNIELVLVEPGAFHTGFNQTMIDSMEENTNKNSIYYRNFSSIDRLTRNVFAMFESSRFDKMGKKIAKEMLKKESKSKIRYPLIQLFAIKLYLLFIR